MQQRKAETELWFHAVLLFKSCSLFHSVKQCHDPLDGKVLICCQVKWKLSVPKTEEPKQELLKN